MFAVWDAAVVIEWANGWPSLKCMTSPCPRQPGVEAIGAKEFGMYVGAFKVWVVVGSAWFECFEVWANVLRM